MAADVQQSESTAWFPWFWNWWNGHSEQVATVSHKAIDILMQQTLDSDLSLDYIHEHTWGQVLGHIVLHKTEDKVVSMLIPPHVKATAKVLNKIFHACQDLKHVKLSDVEEEAMDVLAQHGITSLDLSDWPKLTDEILISLIKANPQLENLDLSDCVLLTEKAIEALAELKSLHSLRAERCTSVPHTAWQQLPKSLIHINLQGSLVNEEATLELSQRPHLETLKL